MIVCQSDLPNTGDLEQHFQTPHKRHETDFPLWPTRRTCQSHLTSIDAAHVLYGDYKNKVDIVDSNKDVQLSRITDFMETQRRASMPASVFLIQCLVFGDMDAREELLTMFPLKKRTLGEHSVNVFMANRPSSLISITADGCHTIDKVSLC